MRSDIRFRLDKFTVQAGREDWKGLRDLVAASDMEVKSAVLGILDSDLSPDAKKGRLKALAGGVPYNVLLKTYYPRLRRVEYTIGYEILQ